ncbi:uncharacterized protein BYT42DRAFT_552048 [Radiomyces spectabilis]|uniref:uncharacterized protein n=1 Tax=Radiomyces spectabilis TaxID=64574 RepID=UPI00221F2FA9|nr:uncharacterized protein BYT42DRAFT_552048 [Radiomyces spectabilis]KAI8393730.1 hypothetical protein BYT42DRAFT_552048 [Radiomyces spectabilis]
MRSIMLLPLTLVSVVLASPVQNVVDNRPAPVPIELFVMSKCPDKQACEAVFKDVLEQVKVPVSLDVNYIASHNPRAPYEHTCMHGSSECLGNIQELCFKHVYPSHQDWFAFDLCLNERLQSIGRDDLLAPRCAQRLHKNFAPVASCIDGQQGIDLLHSSVDRTQSLGVTKSCTVFINNKLRCIHDGSWKECDGGSRVEDFVRTIEDSYRQ